MSPFHNTCIDSFNSFNHWFSPLRNRQPLDVAEQAHNNVRNANSIMRDVERLSSFLVSATEDLEKRVAIRESVMAPPLDISALRTSIAGKIDNIIGGYNTEVETDHMKHYSEPYLFQIGDTRYYDGNANAAGTS